MKAHLGDRILEASHLDAPTRDGDVLEVEGEDGKPPYLVRWTDGHLGLLHPGPALVQGHQADAPVRQIGDEVAVARARRDLANQLLEIATNSIDAATGE